jgi:hypothetical protein
VSWDATLYEVTTTTNCPECGHTLSPPREDASEIGWWNYTHNTSAMIYDALEVTGITLGESERWWQHLHGMSGLDGKEYLTVIIVQLECHPERYRPMNPPNGWGNYYGLLGVLREMCHAVPGEASRWHASG